MARRERTRRPVSPGGTFRFVGVAAVVLAATGLGSASVAITNEQWKAEWQATIARAKGPLILALQQDEAYQRVVDVFHQKFPDIDVQTTISAPSQIAPRIVTEQKNGVYAWDGWWSSAANMNTVVLPAGGFDKITDYFILPEVKDAGDWQDPRFLYTSDRGPYIFSQTNYLEHQALYNTDQLPDRTLSSLDTLLDPRLKGRIAIRAPNRPHGGTMMLAALAKTKGMDFVRRLLTDMSPRFVDNDRQLTNDVIDGDAAIAIGTSEDLYFKCTAEGGCTNVQVLPLAYMHSIGVAVFKDAPHKDAVKVWVNWLLSKEGQETFVREWGKSEPMGAFSNRKDVAPDPKHLDSMPDFAHLDQYVAVSFDSGAPWLDEIMKLYNQTRQ